MLSKNDQHFIAFCDDLRTYVEEHKHFPVRHTTLNNKIRYVRKKINAGTLEEWKLKMFTEIADMRALDEHTGGWKSKGDDTINRLVLRYI